MLTFSDGTKCSVMGGWDQAWPHREPYRYTGVEWISLAILTEQFEFGWRRVWIYDTKYGLDGEFNPEVSVTWQHDTQPNDVDNYAMFFAERLPWSRSR